MEVIDQSLQLQRLGNTILDVPDEILEYIFQLLPPYKDLENCMYVCWRWYHCVQNVKRKISMKFVKAISEFNVLWHDRIHIRKAPSITNRFSHAACLFDNSMFVFGGCTTNATSFNDIWGFNLSTRTWFRPMATGSYPAPKAHSTMVKYGNKLVVFGGWTYTSPNYYQNITMFGDVHFYLVELKKWIKVDTVDSPPSMSGHSALIRGNEMIIFGGLVQVIGPQIYCSNEVWVLNLETLVWRKQPTSDPKPTPRYAQSLIQLDDDRFMILGGAQTFQNRFSYNDCWILTMIGPVWTWKEIAIKNKEWAAANIWCNPACRVGDKVVSLSRARSGWNSPKPLVTSALRLPSVTSREDLQITVRIELNLRRPIDRDQNVNGRRGVLPRHANNKRQNDCPNDAAVGLVSNEQPQAHGSRNNEECERPIAGPSGSGNRLQKNNLKLVRQLQEAHKYRMAAFACEPVANNMGAENNLVNQRQIGHLDNHHDNAHLDVESPPEQPAPKKLKRNRLTIHVLDISNVLNGNSLNYVSWLCPRLGEMTGAPEELVMYSLIKGNGELIMFGGVYNDINIADHVRTQPDRYHSNSLHFITTPRDII